MKSYQIGIDLGGTKIETILFNPSGEELHRTRVPTPRNEDEAANYAAMLDTVRKLILDTAGLIPPASQNTIGIGIPGTINRETHLVQNANTTCLKDRPFKTDLEKLLNGKRRQLLYLGRKYCRRSQRIRNSLWHYHGHRLRRWYLH